MDIKMKAPAGTRAERIHSHCKPSEPDKKAGVSGGSKNKAPSLQATDDVPSGGYGALADSSLYFKKEEKKEKSNKEAQSRILLGISEGWEYFHTEGNPFCRYEVNGARKVIGLKSPEFRFLLSGAFYRKTGLGMSESVFASVLDTLTAKAIHDGAEEPTYIRVANIGHTIYIDLGSDRLDVIEIDGNGWQVLPSSPVNFIRKAGMAPLPFPKEPGNVLYLAELCNVGGSLELTIGWILGALRGQGPFPILIMQGEQGSGKSTTSECIRNLVDPSTVPLRAPREHRDLLVTAMNSHVICLDNLSGLSADLSDCLCRFSTGGGIDMRKLYSDQDQTLIKITKPVMLNGITDLATRPDLSERSLVLRVPVIRQRRTTAEIKRAFEEKVPHVMAGILDALSSGLRYIDTTRIEELPRMADFVLWVTACEEGLPWESGTFRDFFDAMRVNSIADGLDASALVSDRPEPRIFDRGMRGHRPLMINSL